MVILYEKLNSIINDNMKIDENLKENSKSYKSFDEISETEWSIFKEELDAYVSKMGFEKTYVELVDDGFTFEKIFYIKSPKDKTFNELLIYFKKIVAHMESFSISHNLESVFMESYILFD